jgi:hypothetical protein
MAATATLAVPRELQSTVPLITLEGVEKVYRTGKLIGARARDIRRVFTAEGIAVSLAGWLLGIPVGYVLRNRPARAADHAAAPARRPLQARRGTPICVTDR